MPDQNRLTIQINGIKYHIVTDQEPEYVAKLNQELDQSAKELMNANKSMSINEALVLMCLNYLDLSKKAEGNADHLREQITKYAGDATRARAEADAALRELEKLRREKESVQ